MIIKVAECDFRREFNSVRPENFTYEGLGALFEYLEGLEGGSGEQVELDVIAICCEYSEYTNSELLTAYSNHADDSGITDEDECDAAEMLAEHLKEMTNIIKVNNDCYIVVDF